MLSTDGDGSLDDLSCINEKRPRPIVRSISTGPVTKLKRQISTDVKNADDCRDDPIMV